MAKGKKGGKSANKTHKVISKRVRISKNGSKKKGKITMRKAGQDHFNASESGKTMRNKRRDVNVSSTITRNIKRAV